MVRPDREDFARLAQANRAVPLVREVLADLVTPLSCFLKLDDGDTAFLFESVEDEGRWSRYSIVGVGARASVQAQGRSLRISRRGSEEHVELPEDRSLDPLDFVRQLLEELEPAPLEGLPPFAGGAVGFVSYDWVRYVERLPDTNPDPLQVPDIFFRFPERLVVHDRVRDRLVLITVVDVDADASVDSAYDLGLEQLDQLVQQLAGPLEPSGKAICISQSSSAPQEPEVSSNFSRESFCAAVERAREYIHDGDIFQVVPSQRFELPLRCDPISIYRWLRVVNPSPYLFFMRAGDRIALGSSPEILARVEGRETGPRDVALRPIAGTRPRGDTPEADDAFERELLGDPKELAEHIMLVDLGRNDVGRVAEIGSVRVDQLQVIERYSHVMHIVSNVRGRLRPECDAIDVLRATFPAGTLSGAPKIRAMQIIDELEPERRGLYGGAVGYIDYHGRMDMCIAIRTMWIQGDRIFIQAGAGIVADSDPDSEYEETRAKARALLRAVALAEAEST